VGDALKSFLDQSGLQTRVSQAAVVPDWAELVGKQIAAVTEPLRLTRDGTLFVAVSTNAWMSELALMEPQLLQALNAGCETPRVVRLHWRLMR